jgi:hypothetical protein
MTDNEDSEISETGERQGMQTRTYPFSVLVATAALAGLLGVTLGFAASLAAVSVHAHGHTLTHKKAMGPHAWGMGDPFHGGLCFGPNSVPGACQSLDDPHTPIPAPSWTSRPNPAPPADAPSVFPSPPGGVDLAMLAEKIVRERMSVEEATTLADSQGFTARIVEIDGVGLPATEDYRTDRLNFTVQSGVVVKADVG